MLGETIIRMLRELLAGQRQLLEGQEKILAALGDGSGNGQVLALEQQILDLENKILAALAVPPEIIGIAVEPGIPTTH